MKVNEKTVDVEKTAGADIKDQTSEKKTATKAVKSEKAAVKTEKAAVTEDSVKEESSETKTAAKKTTAKPAAKTTKAAAAKKTTAKPAAKTTKTAAKKTTAKPAKVECELYIQYNGNQLDQAVLLERVEEDCVNQGVSVKELKLYLKPEDNACYYVANGSFAGKVDLF